MLGAIVELSGQEFQKRRMVTNRNGMFSFEVRGIVLTVRVLDRGGAVPWVCEEQRDLPREQRDGQPLDCRVAIAEVGRRNRAVALCGG